MRVVYDLLPAARRPDVNGWAFNAFGEKPDEETVRLWKCYLVKGYEFSE